jgi:hypothetical protein
MALDLENKRFLDKPHIVPFIALSDIDKIIESKIDVSLSFSLPLLNNSWE